MHVLTYQRARRISGDPKSKQFWSSLESLDCLAHVDCCRSHGSRE